MSTVIYEPFPMIPLTELHDELRFEYPDLPVELFDYYLTRTAADMAERGNLLKRKITIHLEPNITRYALKSPDSLRMLQVLDIWLDRNCRHHPCQHHPDPCTPCTPCTPCGPRTGQPEPPQHLGHIGDHEHCCSPDRLWHSGPHKHGGEPRHHWHPEHTWHLNRPWHFDHHGPHDCHGHLHHGCHDYMSDPEFHGPHHCLDCSRGDAYRGEHECHGFHECFGGHDHDRFAPHLHPFIWWGRGSQFEPVWWDRFEQILHVDTCRCMGKLYAVVSVSPDRDACELPKVYLDEFFEILLTGTRSFIMRITGRPWTNLQLGQRLYEDYVALIKAYVERDYTRRYQGRMVRMKYGRAL